MWPRPWTLRLAILVGMVAVPALVGRFWWKSTRQREAELRASPSYVGDESCRDCHRTIFDSYKRTAMGRAWYVPTTENTIEDYAQNNHFYDSLHDLHYEMLAQGGKFSQREYRVDEHGNLRHELIRQASYIVGSGEHVRSYVADTGGFLTQLPISWYTNEGKWGLSPGYEEFNHRFSRPIGPGCIACHNDYPTHFSGTLNRYASPVPSGIGCERCHGPAEWHVEQESGERQSHGRGAPRRGLVDLSRLPGAVKDDVCFQCHLQGDTEFVNPGKEQYGFRPGLRLADFRSVYLVESSDSDKFGIASHASRMVLSRCYLEADGRFNCISCHDPHVPLREVAAASYRRACKSCHSDGSCNRTPSSTAAHRQDDCIACHMPRGQPTDVQHTVFTDHRIQRPKQGENQTDSGPLPTGAAPLRAFWKEPAPRDERRGLAYVSYAFAKGGRANLEYGIGLLQGAARRNELHLDGWRKLGMAALARGDFLLAGNAFEKAVALDASDSKSRLGLGMARGGAGDWNRALAELETAIRIAPDQLEAYLAVSAMHMQNGKWQEALAVLERSLEIYPYQPEVLARIGSLYCQHAQDLERGIEALRRAIELDPDNLSLRLALSSAYADQGDLEAASRHLQEALRLSPENVPVLLSLARVHALGREFPRAIECLHHALRADPSNQQAQQLLRELRSSDGPD